MTMLEQWNLPGITLLLLPSVIVAFGAIIIFLGNRKLEKTTPPTRKQQGRRAAFILWLIALIFGVVIGWFDANNGSPAAGWGTLGIMMLFLIGSPIYFIVVYAITALVERQK